MLLNKSSGFGVGPTVNPCTKGLWIWGSPIKGQTQEGDLINIFIIDSEGIGALDEDQAHDSRVFSLAILLSSCFIYNSVGSIDENAIQSLSLVVNLTKHIQIKSGSSEDVDQEEYAQYFPQFFWVLRDFSLLLVDEDGEQITSKDYLEKAMQIQKGFSDEVEQKNRIRRLLSTFFKERDCITLVRPLVKEENLQKLDKMELDQLRPEFFEQVMNLRKKILTRMKPKALNGKELNGEMFISLIKSYLSAINGGAVPNIENAWNYLCKDECHKAVLQSLEIYERSLKEILGAKIPTLNDEIKLAYKQSKEYALEVFRKKAIGEIQEEYLKELLRKMKNKIQAVRAQNEKEGAQACQQFIAREFSSIERKLKLNDYKNFAQFERDLKLFNQFLHDQGPKTVNRSTLFLDFINKMLLEATQHFTGGLQQEIEMQKAFQNEVSKKQQQEIRELKEELLKERKTAVQLTSTVDKERSEKSQNEQKYQDILKELKRNKDTTEQELKEQSQREKQELTSLTQQLKQKVYDVEEQKKDIERQLLLKESTYSKEKALLDQKTQYFQKQVEELQRKEKLQEESLNQFKYQSNSQVKEVTTKLQQEIATLQQRFREQQELNSELNEQLAQKSSVLEQIKEKYSQKELALQQNLRQQEQEVQKLKSQLQENQSQSTNGLQQLETKMNQDFLQLKQQKEKAEELQKTLSEQLKQQQIQHKKEEAVLQQKLQFLESELKDTKTQLVDAKKAYENTLSALEVQNFEAGSQRVDQKQLLELKQNHQKELKQLEQEEDKKKRQLLQQYELLQKEHNEMELKYKVRLADQESELKDLRESKKQSEFYRTKLEESSKLTEEKARLLFRESEEKLVSKIAELEQLAEELKERHQQETRSQQAKYEDALSQLRTLYEIEKQNLEARLVEEKEKRDKNYNSIVEEYEARIREEQGNYENELENLRDEIREYEMQMNTTSAQYDHELEMKEKVVENLEKLLKEAKQTLAQSQQNFNSQTEQQMATGNQERLALQQKVDAAQAELNKREKEMLQIAQKKEYLESTLQKKETQLEELKNEYMQEKALLQEKVEETRRKYQDLSDEYLQHKVNFEKGIALSSQQNEFYAKKVEELEKHLETANTKFEERFKSQKQEWLQEQQEKLGKLQQEKHFLEEKLETLKRQQKDSELLSSRTVSELEKREAISKEKIENYEKKVQEIEFKYQSEMENLNSQLLQTKEYFQSDKKNSYNEIEKLKQSLNALENEKHELITFYERDKVLWEGKFSFLEQQKDQAKQDLQEQMRKFESTIQHLQKLRNTERADQENTTSDMLIQMEKKYQSQIQELSQTYQTKLIESQEKLKVMEKEIKIQQDKLLLEQHNKSNSQLFTEKKMHELLENERKYQAEIDKIKTERDAKTGECQKKFDKEKETLKQKASDIEEKFREAEKKRSVLIFEHEKERAKWNLEKDHLVNQRNEIQEALSKIEKRKEILLRENERLKSDNRASKSRQPHNAVGNSFALNVSKNLGSEKKSPISILGQVNKSYNDYNILNNSITGEEIDKENQILAGVLESNRENCDSMGSLGFKNYYNQVMQDKSQVVEPESRYNRMMATTNSPPPNLKKLQPQ